MKLRACQHPPAIELLDRQPFLLLFFSHELTYDNIFYHKQISAPAFPVHSRDGQLTLTIAFGSFADFPLATYRRAHAQDHTRMQKGVSRHAKCVIMLPDGPKVEIYCGEAATNILRACPDHFRRLLEQQVEATYEVPRLPFWWVRVGLRNLFGPLVEQVGRLFESFDRRIGKPLMDFLYPPGWFFSPNKKKEMEWMWDEAQSLLDQGNFALVTIKGAVVALSAYKLGGKMPDNREVYEITKSFTVPEFRDKGLNRQLRERVIQMITDRHPGAFMMSFTKSGAVIEQCIQLGWQNISIEEYSDITMRIGRSGISPEASIAFQHWKGFLFDPK